MNSYTPMGFRVGRGVRNALLVVAAFAATACNKFLDVDNPNNVVDEALNNPAAAQSIVNGAGTSVMQALNSVLAPYGAVTDELTWSGSRDGFKQLDDGGVSDPANEYVDAATFRVYQARYLTDEAITRLTKFQTDGDLTNPNLLALAYLYGSIIYATIADMYDDAVIGSFRTEAAAPVGEGNMSTLYDKSIDYAAKGLALATTNDLKGTLHAMRARASFGKGVWAKLNPGGTVPAQPLVADANAVTAATTALALRSGDWAYNLTATATGGQGSPASGFEINQRLELAGGDRFFVRNAAGTRIDAVRLNDPITGQPDPALARHAERCCKINAAINGDGRYIPYTVVSARMMHLIIAENALAGNNTTTFASAINAIRAFDGITPWSTGSSVSALDLLKHTRSTSLFMMGHRLADMYRFNIKSDKWVSSSDAFKRVGCFFSISTAERLSNPFFQENPSPPSCKQS
ncbi:MAG: RagB/SusD family nutrient uptake outer membrane protein [Gemmatimonadota bacterium]